MPTAKVHRISANAPDDVSGIEAAIADKRIDPAGIVAIFGKTEGNGLVNDFSRGFATQSLGLMLGSGAGTCLVEAGGSLTCFAGGNEIMSKYPPGVWEDYAGTLHVDIAALRDETVRGYEVSKGQYVKVEDAELEALEAEANSSIEMRRVHPD